MNLIMEKPVYLKTKNKKGKYQFKNFVGKDKENCEFNEGFPQKRPKRSETFNEFHEGIEKFYNYVDKLGYLLNVKTESRDLNGLFNFVEALNKASPLNPAQLKVCEDFGIVLRIEDPESPGPSDQSLKPQISNYIPLKSFQSLLPEPLKPYTIPSQLKIFHLKPQKYSKQNMTL
jgi:hypothetical protein